MHFLRQLSISLAICTSAVAQAPIAYTLFGDALGDEFGVSADGAGDVNADGFDDVIVGAYRNDTVAPDAGLARVFSGYDGTGLFTVFGDAQDDGFGVRVAGAGDVNNDGRDDVIVGAPGNDAAGADAGSATVFSGADGTPLYTFHGQADGDGFGFWVDGAGDVNNDGYADLIVGAPLSDNSGADSGSATVFSGLDGSVLHAIPGAKSLDEFGYCVSKAGDANADGFDDVVVGARLGGANSEGSATVYSGFDGTIIHTWTGNAVFDEFGRFLSDAGDVDGDGRDDVIIGINRADPSGNMSGAARVYSGADGSILYDIPGAAAEDRFGARVSGAGDFNGDGFDDFLVGSSSISKVQLFSGADGSVLFTRVESSRLGGVSRLGDVNGDGRDDFIIGAIDGAAVGTTAGQATVFLGPVDATTLPGAAACIPQSLNANLTVVAATQPIVGTNFDVTVNDSNAAAVAAVILLGFSAGTLSPPVNLGAFNNPACDLQVDFAAPIFTTATSLGVPTTVLSIPSTPTLTGATGLVIQALCVTPTAQPAFVPTDALEIVIGHQ